MNKIIALISSTTIALIFISGSAIGAETLNRQQVEELLKGNTAEGVNTKWDKPMIWYFQEGGTLRKQKPNGKRGRADWSIDKNGQLCYQDKHMDEAICDSVLKGDDGKYDANAGKWRFDKILPGNAHDL